MAGAPMKTRTRTDQEVLVRLSKYLSLAVAMSRNQAKFFIRKGRLSVDGNVITDPEWDVAETSTVVFDGKPISIVTHQYVLMHKPASYSCTTKSAEYPSVLELLNNRPADRYYYFANVLAPEATGLVLFSDDARWTNRVKRRLLKKPRIYQIGTKRAFDEKQLEQIGQKWPETEKKSGPAFDVQVHGRRTLQLKTDNVGMQTIMEVFASADMAIETAQLQQLGRLSLGDLSEGDHLELTEDQIKI